MICQPRKAPVRQAVRGPGSSPGVRGMEPPAGDAAIRRPLLAGRARDAGRRGFQLVELAVVLVILGLALAAATPSFTRRNAWNRLEGAGRELSARVAETRQKAVTRRTPYRLVLSTIDGTYRFERRDTDSTWVREPDRLFTATGASEVLVDVDGSSVADSAEFVFEPRGTVRDGDVPARLALINTRGDTATVSLVRTGRVTIRMTPVDDD